jgi:hypothetical protein
MSERVLVFALIAGMGIVLYRDAVVAGNIPPRPFVLSGVALIYTILAVVALASAPLAAAFGVAIDVGLLISPKLPTAAKLPVTQTDQSVQPTGASPVAVG